MIRIALFASGNGSNAQVLMDRYAQNPDIQVALLLSDNPQAYALQRAEKMGVPAVAMTREQYRDGHWLAQTLREANIDLVVLVGYLKLIPAQMVAAYPHRIVNIHPSLLPKYGGKGMYGANVHRAVLANGEKESGITIHYVNEHYDEGEVILQQRLAVQPGWDADTLQQHIHQLEHEFLPRVVDKICTDIMRK